MPQTERAELAAHVRDVLLRGDAWMRAGLHRVLLRGQAESVVAHRVQDVEPVHALEARVDVGGDVAERVAHMEADAARVREHVEHEHARPVSDVTRILAQQAGAIRRLEDVLFVPTILPLVLDLVGKRGGVALRRNFVGHSGRGYRPRVGLPGWYLGSPTGA